MRISFLFPFLALLAPAFAQAPPTLAEYLKAHPSESRLVVGAETTPVSAEGSGLVRYGRKLVRVGGVAAVVPTTMVRFEESPDQPPNLYDGLPRDAKVIYLMSLLDAAGWAKAAGEGVGASDLRGEARAVLLSLLPHHMAWQEVRVNEDHGWGPITGKGGLDEKESAGVRLRVEQALQFDLPFADAKAYAGALPATELGEPGTTVRMRDDREEEYAADRYGVTLRADVSNVLKKGQLDTSVLNEAVTLPARMTIAEALVLLGRATNREILADVRVRSLSVTVPSGAARVGDLLDALALAVAGTYRRVDGTYLLVADVVGAGSRALRWGLWKGEIDAEVERRKGTWTTALAQSGLALRAGFPEDPTQGATPELRKRIDEGQQDSMSMHWFSTDELSPEQRGFVDREIARHKDRSFVPGRVGVSSSLRYRFVLPDGTPLQVEGHLGPMESFTPHPPYKPIGSDPAVPLAANPPESTRPLAVRLASVDDARRAVATAKAYGFTELWVETARPELLVEAMKGGLPTRLFARPWALPSPRPDSDRTVLGETGGVVAARQAADPLWTAFDADFRLQSYPRRGPQFVEGDLMSPSDPLWPARRDAIAALARTPGLVGVVLADATPRGYEAKDQPTTVGGYGRLLQESWAFGYDEHARLAFFRQVGYDPVDLWTEALPDGVEVDTPTFRKYPAPPTSLVREAYDRWTAFRGKANEVALMGLRAALGDVPVLVDVRRTYGYQPPRGDATLAPWTLGAEPPAYEDQYVPDMEGAIGLVSAPPPHQDEAMVDFGNAVKRFAPMAKVPHAFDLTRVPSSEWDELLGHWLTRRSRNSA